MATSYTSISISSTSVHQPIPAHPKPSKTETALDVSEFLLGALQAAARFSHIPYLQDAAKCALEIIVVTKNVRAHKEAFRRLASDACELVYAVVLTVDKDAPITEQLLDNLRGLLRKLMDIERFARKESDRGLVIRTIRHKSDFDTINDYRDKLKQSLDLFGLQSNISIRQNLARLQEMMEKQEAKLDLEKAEKETAEAERRKKEELLKQLEELERKEREEQERKRKEEKIRLEKYRLEQELQRREREEEERKKNEEKILLEKYRLEQELERRRKERLESEKLAAEMAEKQDLEVKLELLRREEEQQKKASESQIELDKLRRQMQRAEEERVELQRLQWVAEKEERERVETDHGMEEELRAMREAYARTQEDLAALRARATPSPIPSPFSTPGIPYMQSPAGYFPPTGFVSSFGNLSMNNTGGANNVYSGSVLNHNSGNTNTTITSNSNNDSSVRMYGGSKSRRRT